MDKQPATPMTLPGPMVGAWRKTALHFAKKSGSQRNPIPKKAPDAESATSLKGPTDPRHQVQALIKKNIKTIGQIWEVFNQDRQDLSKFLLTTEQASHAYLLGFHLPNAARAMAVLERCLARYPSLPNALVGPTNQIIWSDFACGTGAMAQAITYWLGSLAPTHSAVNMQVNLVDVGTHLLNTAKYLLETQSPHALIKTHKFSLETLRLPGRDTTPERSKYKEIYGVSLGYIWNELAKNPKAKAKMGQLLQSYVSQQRRALVVLLEPATEAMARTIMLWRDQLCEWGYVALYPCPQIKLCPMNLRPKDWCYSEIEWQQPPEAKQLDQLLGSGRHRLATAAYVFASPLLFQDLEPPQKLDQVVVGRPHVVSKPKSDQKGPPPFQYLVCTPQGLKTTQPTQPKGAPPKQKVKTTSADPKTLPPPERPADTFTLRGMLLDEKTSLPSPKPSL